MFGTNTDSVGFTRTRNLSLQLWIGQLKLLRLDQQHRVLRDTLASQIKRQPDQQIGRAMPLNEVAQGHLADAAAFPRRQCNALFSGAKFCSGQVGNAPF